MSFLSSLFGGGSSNQIKYTPQGFSSPGLSYTPGSGVGGSTGTISESPALAGNVGALQSTFLQGANAFGNLAGTVQPGFSQLRRAGLRQIDTTAKANLSTLQGNLAQRKILGSSFANSSISQANADTEQQKANFEAQSYLSELQASTQLTQQQYSMATQAYSTAISQSNIEAGIAAQLTSSNNSIMAQIATANADLQAKAAAGAGSFIGTLFGNIFNSSKSNSSSSGSPSPALYNASPYADITGPMDTAGLVNP